MSIDSNAAPNETDLLPVRMLSEFAYCPRLFYLMHVEAHWADNHFTVEGKTVHRRVDDLDHVLPDAEFGADIVVAPPLETPSLFATATPTSTIDDPTSDEPPAIFRSVPLGSDELDIIAELDLVSSDGSEAVPVETKRGKVPDNDQRSWESERVQLMAQGLLLREAGYNVDHGILYFAGSRTRVTVPFTLELEAHTRQLIAQARQPMALKVIPDPLEDSPKCRGCSLNAICLPDETLALKYKNQNTTGDAGEPRRMFPVRDDAVPLYIQTHGACVGTSRGSIVVNAPDGNKLATVRLHDTSQVVLAGNISIIAQALHILAEHEIPIVHLSGGHYFHAVTVGQGLRNAFDRAAQFDAAKDPAKCLALARQLVIDKAANQRTILRRNATGEGSHEQTLIDRAIVDIDDHTDRAKTCDNIDALRGIEGSIAARYFSQFSSPNCSNHATSTAPGISPSATVARRPTRSTPCSASATRCWPKTLPSR